MIFILLILCGLLQHLQNHFQMNYPKFSSVQLETQFHWLFATPRTAACQAFLSFTNSWSLLKLMSINHATISSSVVPFFSCLQSFPASGSFPESVFRIKWQKYWSFSISTSNEYSGLISFRMDWFDLLAIQGTLNSLLPHHNSEASNF